MSRKAATVDLKGKEYATVPERLRLFREDSPNGSIITDYKFLEDGKVVFTTYILKDKNKPESGDATGHSMGEAKNDKGFEKLETISIGRALAILGYLASGDIASSEEMEAFNEYKENQRADAKIAAIAALEDAGTLEELKTVFLSLGGLIADTDVVEAKDKRKVELS